MSERSPKVRVKTPEEIQAQVAAYAAEKIGNTGDRNYVFKNLVGLAAKEAEDVKRVTEKDEYNWDKGGEVTPADTEKTIVAKDYTEFLRSVGGSKYEAIEGRAEILSAYKDFAPVVNELKENLKTNSDRKGHSSFLGNGSNSSVFLIERAGKKYAVRIPGRGEGVSPSAIDHHLAAAFLSKGVPHLEQIVAASYEDGVTVAELMPGAEMGKLTIEDVQSITDNQLNKLIDTLSTAHERRINIDPKPSNFFYDREAGFGIVDIASSKVLKNSQDQDLGTVIAWVVTAISNAGSYGQPHKEMLTVEEYAQELEFSKVRLDVKSRYRNIVEEKLEGNDLEVALKILDKEIQVSKEGIAKFSNPEYVAELIANAEQRVREKETREKKGKGAASTWTFLS